MPSGAKYHRTVIFQHQKPHQIVGFLTSKPLHRWSCGIKIFQIGKFLELLSLVHRIDNIQAPVHLATFRRQRRQVGNIWALVHLTAIWRQASSARSSPSSRHFNVPLGVDRWIGSHPGLPHARVHALLQTT